VIKKGIESAKPLAEYKSYREQGFARQFADWLVGMNLTRLVTLKANKTLHFGRVQTAVLGAVYEREKAILNFNSEKYFELSVTMNKDFITNTPMFSVKLVNPDNEEYPTRFSEPSFFEKFKSLRHNEEGLITSLKKDKKTIQPPQLFNITGLQKEAHKKYGYSPERALDIAQALYEKHKCLSYPRTPSRVMGDDNVELIQNCYKILKENYTDTALDRYMSGADPSLINSNNKRLFNTAELQDHHALIPLKQLPADASEEERNIYILVFERFFVILKHPYIYNSISIDVDISGHKFIGNGIEVLEKGWRCAVDINLSEHDDEYDEDLYEDHSGLEQGKSYLIETVETLEQKTKPKKHYTFATLLQLMENPRGDDGRRLTGLGTPATRGAILQKLVDRKYVLLKGKNVLISDDGNFLIENILNNDDLASFISIPETTRWEEQLHNDTAAFIEGIKDFVRGAVKNTGMEAYQQPEKKSFGKCPVCKTGDIYEGKNNYYCGNYKADPPCKFVIWKNICQASVTHSDLQALLVGKQTKVKKCVSPKTGKEFNAKFELVNGKIEFRFEEKK